jgi:hypothetical protein
MARNNEQVLQTLASVTTSATYKYRKRKGHDIIAYSVTTSDGTSTFTGTYKLESSVPGSGVWADVPNGAFTAETSGTFVPGGNMDVRWNCTAYTTGSQIVRLG